MSARVVVVGGGISGLAAAERLTSAAPDARVVLLEERARLGGHIRTERAAGFVMEVGPDVFLAAKPAAVELCRRLGIAERIVGTSRAAAGSFILRRERLVPVPAGMSGLVPSQLRPFATTPLLSPLGKLRAGMEYFVPPRRAESDESIERFIVRRLGREMYVRLLEPLLSGMVAGDGARLSLDATFPQLRELERAHGSLLRGALAARRAPRPSSGSAAPAGLVSLDGGLGAMIERLEEVLAARGESTGRTTIRRAARVEAIERAADGPGWRVRLTSDETLDADAVIVAAPAWAAAALLPGVDEPLARLLGEIEYASTVTISLGYRVEHVPPLPAGTGYTVPREERRPVLACTFASAKFSRRAPEGRAQFRLFLGGAGRGEFVGMSDEALTAVARGELREVLGVRADPELVRINRLPRALPQYNLGHLERLGRIEGRLARLPGLFLSGAAYRGVGIPDCIRSGEGAADAALRLLGTRAAGRVAAEPAPDETPAFSTPGAHP